MKMLVLVTSIEIIYSFETHHNGETRDSTGSLGSIIKGIVIAYSITIFMVGTKTLRVIFVEDHVKFCMSYSFECPDSR